MNNIDSIKNYLICQANGLDTMNDSQGAKAILEICNTLIAAINNLQIEPQQTCDIHIGYCGLAYQLLKYQKNNQADKDEVFEKMKKNMEREFENIRIISSSLEQGLSKCDKLRLQYDSWLKNSQTPIDAMLKSKEIDDHEQLRKTLDITKCQRVKGIIQSVESELSELDNIIQSCVMAISMDYDDIKKKASGK